MKRQLKLLLLPCQISSDAAGSVQTLAQETLPNSTMDVIVRLGHGHGCR